MENNKDYYSILGITEEEKKLSGSEFQELVKKKYRKLAMQYHPDRWANSSEAEKKEAEEKFKSISEANEILSDPQKRQMYDNGGNDFDFNGFDPMEMFRRMTENMGGGFDDFGFGFFGNRGQRVNKGSNIETHITITLQEAYDGVAKEINIPRKRKCIYCNGTGSYDGKSHDCPTCGGKGFVSSRRQIAQNSFQIVNAQCPNCHGMGRTISKPCTHCNGTGLETEYAKELITIPRGISNNMVFVVPELGNEPEGNGINGDLHVIVNVMEDSYFKRPDEMNVIHYEDVPFNEALIGFKKEFKCLDGSVVTVNAPELTPHGKSFIFKGKGMPNPNDNNYVGDYAVVIRHKLPSKLTEKQKEMLKNFYK